MKILLKRGTTSKVNDASLDSGEVAIDTTTKTLTLGTTVKKHTVQASKVATKTSQLSNELVGVEGSIAHVCWSASYAT